MAPKKVRIGRRTKGRMQGTNRVCRQLCTRTPLPLDELEGMVNDLLRRCGQGMYGDVHVWQVPPYQGLEYGEVSDAFAHWLARDLLLSMSSVTAPPGRFLDFGCGVGRLCLQLAFCCPTFHSVAGVEIVLGRTCT